MLLINPNQNSNKNSYCQQRLPSKQFILARAVLYRICILVTFLQFIHIAQTRRLQPCEFAGQLYILDVPKTELPLWSCIAEYESRYHTDAIGKRNLDGSFDYGIFQISDKYWCQPQNKSRDLFFSANECNVNCTDLLLDDITQAVRCARIILKQQGWTAWSVYGEFCNETSTSLSDIEYCFV
ncbi:lysozyme 1 [Lucilia sericata]|uniref:lysozyme 1 n=1 Tax=Lucilia sericata TaxID=13632 RepID=UPI0018A7E8BA|nr:lysozyme 1 [Lucilia sericata]